ncbi:hypothetical protein DFH94DRAFT_844464 [Russula ochroleuca]|uniref:Uncharacterized protein n=1 Tax=Russula ochroleuca TaxID=152965 RepID=A0A9P5MX29_9AGAM|nr:hypothetical protein DFH94DRAFT_844464 [Russula ochroleuca]
MQCLDQRPYECNRIGLVRAYRSCGQAFRVIKNLSAQRLRGEAEALSSITRTIGPFTVMNHLRFAYGESIGPLQEADLDLLVGPEHVAHLVEAGSVDRNQLSESIDVKSGSAFCGGPNARRGPLHGEVGIKVDKDVCDQRIPIDLLFEEVKSQDRATGKVITPGECGYQSEWYMWETTYRRVGIYIHEAGTRVLTYDIDRLDEISLIGALSRRACRETHTSQIDSGLTPPVLPLLPLVSCRHGRTQR